MKKDLDQIIAEFQRVGPTADQLLRWSLAAQEAKLRRKSWIQIAASVAAGLLIGIVMTRQYWAPSKIDTEEQFSATFTVVTVKDH